MRCLLVSSLCTVCRTGSERRKRGDATPGTDAKHYLGVRIYIRIQAERYWASDPLSLGLHRRVCVHFLSGDITLTLLYIFSLLVVETLRFGPKAWVDASPVIAEYFVQIFCIGTLLALSAQWTFANQFAQRNASFWSAYVCQNVSPALLFPIFSNETREADCQRRSRCFLGVLFGCSHLEDTQVVTRCPYGE